MKQYAQKAAFVTQATDAVLRATGGHIPKARIFVNMVYGDDLWGIGGVTYDDKTLLEEVIAADPKGR